LGNEAQHHRRTLKSIKQIDAYPHESEGMSSVELFELPEVVDLLWSEQLC
jgi:hypothetical protein